MSNTGFYKKYIRQYINNVNKNYKVSYLLSYDELLINEQNKNIQELNASPIPSHTKFAKKTIPENTQFADLLDIIGTEINFSEDGSISNEGDVRDMSAKYFDEIAKWYTEEIISLCEKSSDEEF